MLRINRIVLRMSRDVKFVRLQIKVAIALPNDTRESVRRANG